MEISAGYTPSQPDLDDPTDRSGWALFDYLDRLEDGTLEAAGLDEDEARWLRGKGLLPA